MFQRHFCAIMGLSTSHGPWLYRNMSRNNEEMSPQRLDQQWTVSDTLTGTFTFIITVIFCDIKLTPFGFLNKWGMCGIAVPGLLLTAFEHSSCTNSSEGFSSPSFPVPESFVKTSFWVEERDHVDITHTKQCYPRHLPGTSESARDLSLQH